MEETEGLADFLLGGSAGNVDLVAEDEERDVLEVVSGEEILQNGLIMGIRGV